MHTSQPATVRTVWSRPPRPWQRHGRLTLEVTSPDGTTQTARVIGGTIHDIADQIADQTGVTEWRWI